jgi:methyl-accepting chemotaxis protein
MTIKLPLDARGRRGSAAITARADGTFDLTQTPERGGDQLAELVADMQGTLAGIGEITVASGVAAAKNSLAVRAIGSEVEHLRSEIDSVAHALGEMRLGVDESSRAAAESANLADSLSEETDKGLTVVHGAIESIHEIQSGVTATVESIRGLAESLKQIGEISLLIEDVAQETNLLALNAAIEAARAGENGRTFAVVADQVRELAERTSNQTQTIAELISGTTQSLRGLEQVAAAAQSRSDEGVTSAAAASESLERMRELVASSTEPAARVASAVAEQLATLERVSSNMDATAQAAAAVEHHTADVTGQTASLSLRTERAYALLGRFYAGTFVDDAVDVAHDLSRKIRGIFEEAIESGRLTLNQVLALEYQEITGPRIASLRRLFDVSRVPATGFDPPKFSTAYDALVDEAITRELDAALAPEMAFTTLFDLNAYLPAHNGKFTQDWTGDPIRDLAQNRTKRSFLESGELLRACRHGLGVDLPAEILSRPDIERRGCALTEPDGSTRDFLVQTYARDTGAVMVLVSVPLYVGERRFGAVCVAWEPRDPSAA